MDNPAQQQQYHRPFRNYPAVRHRGPAPAARRRQWSAWRITVNPNITATTALEQELVSELLIRATRRIFSRPGLIGSFMEPQQVAWNMRIPPYERVARDFRGDDFDGAHVFQHTYTVNTETGSRFSRPHAMITYSVLHDSAFRMNVRVGERVVDEAGGYISFPYLFARMFNEVLEAHESPYLDINGWRDEWERQIDINHPGVWVKVRAERLYKYEEYEIKRDARQAGKWSNPTPGASARDPLTGGVLPAQQDAPLPQPSVSSRGGFEPPPAQLGLRRRFQ